MDKQQEAQIIVSESTAKILGSDKWSIKLVSISVNHFKTIAIFYTNTTSLQKLLPQLYEELPSPLSTECTKFLTDESLYKISCLRIARKSQNMVTWNCRPLKWQIHNFFTKQFPLEMHKISYEHNKSHIVFTECQMYFQFCIVCSKPDTFI